MRKLLVQPDDRILVVSPHPDDETIGCGALLALYGSRIDLLLITDGRNGHVAEVSEEECVETRKREITNLLEKAQVANLFALGIPDGRSYQHKKEIVDFDYRPYSKVFIPNRFEEHVDHRVANTEVKRALKAQRAKADVYEYEVWTTLLFPNAYIDCSEVIEKKAELLSCYESQLAMRNYYAMSEGLGLYRGVSCRCAYAEAYEHIEWKHALKPLFFKLPLSVQNVVSRS